MKRELQLLIVTIAAGFATIAADAAHDHAAAKPIALIPGLSNWHHKVSTKNEQAQAYFDQGLRLTFAFHHEAAILSYQKAADLDPNLAMAHWGIAYALGPNINMDVDANQERQAYDEVQKALALAPKASRQEQDYIAALATRYTNDPKADLQQLSKNYAAAMKTLWQKYPKDYDAATLYAESLMDLHPWKLWRADGTPEDGTLDAIAALEYVMKHEPDHIGANHFYLHAVEASQNPTRALPAARRLEKLAPAAGHLVHMPAHIYMRVGQYMDAARANDHGAHADEAYFDDFGMDAVYPMYYGHNLHFLAIAASMAGQFKTAKAAADKLAGVVEPQLKDAPFLDAFYPTNILVLVKFHRYDDILQQPEPASPAPITHALWHFARGMAFAEKGRADAADKERQAFVAETKAISSDSMMGLNKTKDILAIADYLLSGAIAVARQSYAGARDSFQKAANLQDSLAYDEPPIFFLPAREFLGGALLKSGQFAEAEKAFRADLPHNPHNGRALFGIYQSLKAQGQGRKAATDKAFKEFQAAWKDADTPLNLDDPRGY